MYQKTEGIVLRETEYRDNDRLLTVLTREFGKITVKARGAKRGKLRAACQLLTFSELTLLEQQGRYILTEANVKEMFTPLRGDLERFFLASYFAQVTDVVSQEEDPMPAVLSLLLNSLFVLCRDKLPQKQIKAVFELRMACLTGYLPDLRGCAVCGCTTPDRFNITQGTVQCAHCAAEDGIRMPLSAGTLEAMRFVTQTDRIFSFRLSDAALEELNAITESYLCTRLERGFHTLDSYKSLFL